MRPGVLTVNAGSSSVKYALYAAAAQPGAPVVAGQVEGIGSTADSLTHGQAFEQLLDRVGASASDVGVAVVGHRIVHGGTAFGAPALIDDMVYGALRALEPLAPLHQPHNLAGVAAARAAFPGVPQVACFDTAFHHSQPAVQQRFALPAQWHEAGVRRYGFHGLSYESIAAQLAATEPDVARGRVVVAHLGNGASMCAMHGGRSVATTMGFSTLDGLTMGTRCGRLDAGVLLHLMSHHGLDATALSRLLYDHSGLLGLSGLSADMRTLLGSAAPLAELAVDHFVETAARELAGMASALRGIDALVFTGGIGQHAAPVRARLVQACGWMGLALDEAANSAAERAINAPGSTVQIRVLRTDEEAVIARHALQVAGLAPSAPDATIETPP